MLNSGKFLFLCLLLSLAGPAGAAPECLDDNVEGQLITGRLSVIDAQDAAGRAERPYILALPEATCLNADDPDAQVDGAETVHIYANDPALAQRVSALVGKSVIVKGRPFVAHTAHHHAPIVMEISEISPN